MRIKLVSFFLVFITVQVAAQKTSSSPFSSFGFGEKDGMDHATFTGLGNSTITYFDSTVVNFYNPSTYNTLGQGQPIFSLGVTSRLSFYNQNTVNVFKAAAFVDHFAMAFTLKKHFGLAFGLKPFSRKGYEIAERVAVGSDSLKYSYIGSGGTNQVFIGLSTNLIKLKKTTLSVGTNLSYLFGASTNERRSQLISGTELFGGIDYNTIRMNSFHYEFGAFFRQTLRERHDFTFAGVLEPAQSLNATLDNYLFQGTVGNPNTYDTLFSTIDQTGKIKIASTLNLGFNYNFKFKDTKKDNASRNSEIGIHLNYSTTDWTTFSSTFDPNSALRATSKLTFGIQYTPEYKFLENSINSSFLGRTRYRVGYYQYTLPYSADGSQLRDFGTTFGFGIPIMGQQSLSSVNVGFSLGKRENGEANTMNEKYIGINFGVCLAPANFERWFKKRKLD